MIRALLPLAMAFALVLGSLTAVVAQTRMVAAGGYCGTGAPQILRDAAGLPILSDDGTAIAVPDCPACHIATALLGPWAPMASPPSLLALPAPALPKPRLSPLLVHLGGQARAPPPAA